MFSSVSKLASAIHNNILSGLAGYHTNFSISMELLEDTVVQERLQIIKELSLKGVINPEDLYISINCVPVDCKDLERCKCSESDCLTITAHFEIPQLINDLGDRKIQYLGSNDRQNPFVYYTSMTSVTYRNYRKRKSLKPYVWIDTTPNENGMYDCFLFNGPLINQVSITAAFKDLRQLLQFECCILDEHISGLDALIVDRVSKKMILYYRQLHMPPYPNNQQYSQG